MSLRNAELIIISESDEHVAVLEKALDFLSGDYTRKTLRTIWDEEGTVLCLLRSVEENRSIVIYTKPSQLRGMNRIFFMSVDEEKPHECQLTGMRNFNTINLADVVIYADEESCFD